MKKIFYSWQSDLPNSANRSFIEKSINNALKELKGEKDIVLETTLDRDTLGLSGSPDIENSIFNKIDDAIIFVADVSIINQRENDKNSFRPCPNPNVLIELGYAKSKLGLKNIILVQNTYFGSIEQLPFDLRGKRVLAYSLDPTSTDKTNERKLLTSHFKSIIKPVLTELQTELETKTRVILYSFENNKFSVVNKMKMTLNSTDPIKLVFNLIQKISPDPKIVVKKNTADSIKNYKILSVLDKKWVQPEFVIDINEKIIAFIPLSAMKQTFDDKGNAKYFSFMIESFNEFE